MPKDKTDKDQAKKRRKPKSDAAEEAEPEEEEETLKPVDFKIGEDSENLRQREEWFQKRHK